MIDLDGAIDLHVHTAPDVYDRSVTDDEQVLAAVSADMRAVLLKSHHTLTADRATLAAIRHGARVFGGLALNLSVGGLNPVAVETAIALGAKQIWMPTLHAANCLARAEQKMFRAEAEKGRVGITLRGDDGEIRPQVHAILEQVRDADIALGTGHLSPAESLDLLRLARDMGLRRLLVTHPLMSFCRFTLAQMRDAVALGAKLEFDYLSCSPHWAAAVPPARTAEAINAIGAAHCILATDGGQTFNPPPVQMLTDFANALAKEGIPADAIAAMTRDNPAWILDL
jgi:hypothetical protein